MGSATITITDNEDGGAEVDMVYGDAEEFDSNSMAHLLGLKLLHALSKEIMKKSGKTEVSLVER